ncbi:arylesterase [bacterium]|nr:arylesterase [bacterium]
MRLSKLFIVLFFSLGGIFPALAEAPAAARPVIVAFGDSLSAGYRLPPTDSFPAQLQAALNAEGIDARVVNMGLSGDTTAGGVRRLESALAQKPQLVILELGANDALRGLPPAEAKKNLATLLEGFKKANVPVILAGMRAPRNLGPDYTKRFDAMYEELAEQYGARLYPFFLEGVAMNPSLNLDDGLHPNRQGVAIIVKGMVPLVKGQLKR